MMKKCVLSLIALVFFGFYTFGQDLSPYIRVGKSAESIDSVSSKVISSLKANGFQVLGAYNPSKKASLKVIAFTKYDLKTKVVKDSITGVNFRKPLNFSSNSKSWLPASMPLTWVVDFPSGTTWGLNTTMSI